MSFQGLGSSRRTSRSSEGYRFRPYDKPGFRAAHTHRDSPAPPSRPSQHEDHAFKQALRSTDLTMIAKAVAAFAKQHGLTGQQLTDILHAIEKCPPRDSYDSVGIGNLLGSLKYCQQDGGTPPEVYRLLQAITGLVEKLGQGKLLKTTLASLIALEGVVA